MSKKPTPSKKQCPSSTGSRHGTYVRNARIRLENALSLNTCKKCGERKRSHFACEACGWYGDKKIVEIKTKGTPTQEIQA